MANVGTAASGKTLIGAGNGSSPTYADIGTNSGLTVHGVVIAEGNGAFQATTAGSTGQVLTSNGVGVNPSFQPVSASGAITTINGDSGSISGSTVTIYAQNSANNAGSSVKFVNSGTVSTLNVTDASANTFIGQSAGKLTTTTTGSTGVGFQSLQNITSGISNTALGHDTATSMTTGALNTAIGEGAMFTSNASNCVAVGWHSLLGCTADNTVGVGYGVLQTCTGTENTCVGTNTLAQMTSGTRNTAMGISSGNGQISNSENSSFGAYSLLGNIGSQNTAVGAFAGYSNAGSAAASQNSLIGYLAGAALTSSSGNSSVGASSLASATSGSGNNSSLGQNSLKFLLTGTQNTCLGYNSGSSYTTSESSNICINNTGTVAESNVMRLGTTGSGAGQVSTAFIAGVASVSVSSALPVLINSSTGQLGTGPSAGIFSWTDVTGTSQTIAVNSAYLSDNAGTVTFALPATAPQFSIFRIVGVQGAWTITQAANQQIRVGSSSSTLGATGSISSSNARDCVEVIAVVGGASTIWSVMSSMGNITVA